MTQPTDDLAAQMVREMRVKSLSLYSDEMLPIARRYMEKLFTENELHSYFAYRSLDNSPDDAIKLIRVERAGKEGR